jgi:hypothetical protein
MKHNKKYFQFYKDCMITGKLPKIGLCNCFPYDSLFELFSEGPGERRPVFWGYGGVGLHTNSIISDIVKRAHKFTPLRQTIVLLMAAMNGEL